MRSIWTNGRTWCWNESNQICNSTYGNQLSIPLCIETKHRVPFVLDMPRHDSKQLYLLCIEIVERKICSANVMDLDDLTNKGRRRCTVSCHQGANMSENAPTFLRSRVSCLKASQELRLYKQVKYWGTFMKHWQMIPIFSLTEKARVSAAARFLTQQHWSVPRHVTPWQKMLVTLPATFPCVKWEVFRLCCPNVFWMQAAWHSHVQVASIYGKVLFETGS